MLAFLEVFRHFPPVVYPATFILTVKKRQAAVAKCFYQAGERRSGGLFQSIRAKSYGFIVYPPLFPAPENETTPPCPLFREGTHKPPVGHAAGHLLARDRAANAEYAPRRRQNLALQ